MDSETLTKVEQTVDVFVSTLVKLGQVEIGAKYAVALLQHELKKQELRIDNPTAVQNE